MQPDEIIKLKDKKVALLGFGIENQALLSYLQKEGAIVTICDRNSELSIPGSISSRLGDDYLKNLTDFEVIFCTPGIPYLTREIQEARQAGVLVTSQMELFFERAPAKIIGVTGTKGKGTTATLVKYCLDEAKKKDEIKGEVYLAGNIGTPPIGILGQLTADDWVIVELSSFQLQGMTKSPHIAVILNITIDHLDHHKDEAEYISAKKNIARYQTPSDYLIVNLDSLTSILFADETPAKTFFFSRLQSVDQGAFVERRLGDDKIILRLPGRGEETICQVGDVRLYGEYHLENITAAIVASALAGAGSQSIKEGITSFPGLPHRLQFVTEVGGVRYFDDSKSTTPDSTIAAVLSFDAPITLIVGGSSKGADYSEMVRQIAASSVRSVICIGQEGERIRGLLEGIGAKQKIVTGFSTMEEIVREAQEMTSPGGVVLLSPAAASFDMFANAEDRGDQFQREVQKIVNSK